MPLSTSAMGSDPEWLQSRENWNPAGSIMLLVMGFNPKPPLSPSSQCLSQGKTHSPSTEHSPKAHLTANLSQGRQSWSTVLWEGSGHVMVPTQWAPKEIPHCKTWDRAPPHPKQLHTEVLGTTEGHSAPLQHTENVHTLCNPAARTQGRDEISQNNSTAAA